MVEDSYLCALIVEVVSQNVAAVEMDDVMVAADDSLDAVKALRVKDENEVRGGDEVEATLAVGAGISFEVA